MPLICLLCGKEGKIMSTESSRTLQTGSLNFIQIDLDILPVKRVPLTLMLVLMGHGILEDIHYSSGQVLW